MQFQPGTIISGTLRDEDLVPAFLTALKDLAPERAATVEREYADAIAHLQQGLEHPDIEHLVPELNDLLNTHAPDGYHFGTVEGDGADFGFWENEPDEDDDIEEENK